MALLRSRDTRHGRRRIMARGRHHLDAIASGDPRDFGPQLAEHRAGGHDLTEDFSGQAESVDDNIRPLPGPRIEQLARAGDGSFIRHFSTQPIGEKIGNE